MTSTEVHQDCPSTRDYLPWGDANFRADPNPFYARALAEAPVTKDVDGTYVLTKYEDLMHYGRLPSMLIAPTWEGGGPWSILIDTAIGTDAPDHSRLRRITNRWLGPKAVQGWVTATAAIADEVLDRMGPEGLIDGSDLGTETTHRTGCRLLQVPEDGGERARLEMRKSMFMQSAVAGPEDIELCAEAHEHLRARTAELIEYKQRNPGTGLLDHLLALRDSGEINQEEMFANVLFYFFVAHMDASYLIAAGLHLFAERPDIFTVFKEHPEHRQAIVTELVRWDAPEPATVRQASEDLVVRGVHIPAGSMVRLLFGSANRDPEAYDDPNVFDYQRSPEQTRNLTFSMGRHACQGQILSEAEILVVLERVAARCSRVELAAEPVKANIDASKHYLSLPLRLVP